MLYRQNIFILKPPYFDLSHKFNQNFPNSSCIDVCQSFSSENPQYRVGFTPKVAKSQKIYALDNICIYYNKAKYESDY